MSLSSLQIQKNRFSSFFFQKVSGSLSILFIALLAFVVGWVSISEARDSLEEYESITTDREMEIENYM